MKKLQEKNKIEKMKKQAKGITLIALVITIIVLLIFSGVSIAMMTGDNGILTQAQNAKEKTEKASELEGIQLAVIGSETKNNEYLDILDEKSFQEELEKNFGNEKLDVVINGDGSFIVTINDRKYYVNDDKTVISSDNIIEINDEQGLMNFRDDVNSGNSYEGKAVLLTSDIILSGNWTPIGIYSKETEDNHYLDVPVNKPFKGIFDGCNHTISNLQIDSTEDCQGLFGLVIDGTIRDITIAKGSSITAGSRSGVIVGTLHGFSGNISNCTNYSDANFSGTGGGIVGGLAGQHTVANCKNYGTISSQGVAGGIVGSSNGTDWPEEFSDYYHKIINCGNYGNISTTGKNVGGVVGYFKGKILGCCNKGEISGNSWWCGGIIGQLDGMIQNSYNRGNVSGQERVGGILGATGEGIDTKVENCYSLADVNGDVNVGEIVGRRSKVKKSEIVNCYTREDTFTVSDLGDAFVDNPENVNQPLLYWEMEDESY